MIFEWGKGPELDRSGFEVSTAGDRRFSAFNARIVNPWRPEPAMTRQERGMPRMMTIEYAYQVHIKGHYSILEGKGRPPKRSLDCEQLWEAYLGLWLLWAEANPSLMAYLRRESVKAGWLLTDQFAKSTINQAHALAFLLNNEKGTDNEH